MLKHLMLLTGVLCACGDDSGGHVVADAAPHQDASSDASRDAPIDSPSCNGGKTLFLNRAGGTYNASTADDATLNNTKVLASGSFAVPAYPYGDGSWSTIKTCITSQLAPFDVTVTDIDPGTAPHHELVLTTNYAAWPNGNANVSTISGTNCPGGLPASGVAFVFAAAYGDLPALTCEAAVAQFAIEITGLDWSLDCHDYLGQYQAPCGQKVFLDQMINCGESTPRTCQCGGTAQNSYQTMRTALCN